MARQVVTGNDCTRAFLKKINFANEENYYEFKRISIWRFGTNCM